ncbi:MAG: hypothetical protein HYV09_06600 [Deltaproteobacteria bacterium]|nr:hypothetical protein [Deltaproteobacteria bacterium]
MQNSLVIHPQDETVAIEPAALDAWLIAQDLAREGRPGPRFAELIDVEGVSVDVVQRLLRQHEGASLAEALHATAIRGAELQPRPMVIVSCEMESPCCRPCGSEYLGELTDLLDAWWNDPSFQAHCPCGAHDRVPALDWKHLSGFARTSFAIESPLAFVGMTPTAKLLDALRAWADTPWTWTWTAL